uniref:Non-structural polyprotein 1AB n=1 Tax=Rousettus bat astrovirus TaxID=3141900 RepID=A0AAU7E2F7_9VIRU
MYGAAQWGREAYIKSFEKFTYKTPTRDVTEVPHCVAFADWAMEREYSFLANSVMIPITHTDKNVESTPAYPKCLDYGTEAEYIEANGFGEYVSQSNEIFRTGGGGDVLWVLFLKKEILKSSKIKDSDIRQIVCADSLYQRIGLMFEQHQNEKMKDRTRHSHGQCGWCPFYGGFQRRIRRLLRKGNPYFIELDWTRYDGTIPNFLIWKIKDFRFRMLAKRFRTPQNRAVYDWYVSNLLNRHVLMPSGEVTLQTCGNPSGQVSTTMDNNMINTWLQAFEFCYVNGLTFDEAVDGWDDYDTIIYGDDRLSTTPYMPIDYVDRVVDMYAQFFGMWVKPEKVKVSDTVIGLAFCGFTVLPDLSPVPTDPRKLIASLNTPLKRLSDPESLFCKLQCFQILMANLPDEDPIKEWVAKALFILAQHLRASGREVPTTFTRDMLVSVWRGGPKDDLA